MPRTELSEQDITDIDGLVDVALARSWSLPLGAFERLADLRRRLTRAANEADGRPPGDGLEPATDSADISTLKPPAT